MWAAGCGYGLVQGPGLAAVAKGRPVEVGAFENRSFEADAALTARVSAGRTLAARGLAGSGGLVLAGVVEGVTAVPVGVVGPQDVQLWRAEVRLRFSLRDPHDPVGKPVASSFVVESEDYRTAADIEATEVSRRLAIERAIERGVADGIDRLAP